MILRMNNC